jgi:hypothetical protein
MNKGRKVVYTDRKVAGTTKEYRSFTGGIFTGKTYLCTCLGEKRKTVVPNELRRFLVTYLKLTIYV